MRALALVGLIAVLFSAGSYYTSGRFGAFAWLHAVAGAGALGLAFALWLRRRPGFGTPTARRILLPRVAWVIAMLGVAIGAERAVSGLGWTADLTADARYTLAPATRDALAALRAPVAATLYVDPGDNRARSTRLLLQRLAEAGPVEVRERALDEASDDVAEYGIASSNAVVLSLGERFELVMRPTEGALYEGLRRLIGEQGHVVYVARGEGEGDLQRGDDGGFSGLAAALQTEGFLVRDFVAAGAAAIPEDASLLLVIGAARPLRAESLAAIDAWLARGGRLVAMLEPGTDSGLEALLARWGFGLPDAVIVDPASGPVEGDPPGVNPIVYSFATHPVTRGLDATRMVFFRKARPVLAERKPESDDDLRAVAFASRRSWLAPNAAAVQSGAAPERPPDVEESYWPVLSVGRYPRGASDAGAPVEARIAVFGDADFASNRSLRALYNLDLLMNTVHWATQREQHITLRPKALTPDQYPLTPQQSLDMLYGVGLLIPELCLAAAAWTWLRRRSG
ncbi:MAG: hypothetical protein DCC71_00325 [Proteobacteria bacterium]|nr:MAG: hypothetical protein DCC71_00325 [Pseudomonadota bacterium]